MTMLKRIFILTILFSFVSSFIVTSYPVSANSLCTIPDKNNKDICLDSFFSGNDILYYDPNAEECTLVTGAVNTSGPLAGNDNTEKVFLFLTGKGLSAEQAAGAIANFKKEAYARIDPGAIQGGAIADENYTPVHGTGFGIAQWTWDVRQQPLVALSKSSNRPINDLSLQLDYVWKELNGEFKFALETLKATTTPEQAAYVFHRDYEASDDTEAEILATRAGPARAAYELLKGLTPTNADSTDSVDCGSIGGDGLTEFMGDNFVIYNQCQFPPYGGSWGTQRTVGSRTVCSDGCIPTSIAMISKNLVGRNVTPADTANYYSANNLWAPAVGSYIASIETASPAFGLRAEKITDKGNLTAYKEVFDKGGLIIAMSAGSSPFMSSSHAIVLRGITADGNFMIADPGQRETNIAPANQPSTEKILTDIRSDTYSASYALYKQ